MTRLKTVIHVHTNYSYDGNAAPAEVVATAQAQGVHCLAVTDHDTIHGALAARALGHVQVVVGAEITTADGHLIGLFLERNVPAGRPAVETAWRIRDQGGLVFAPHPLIPLSRSSLSRPVLERLMPWLDAVEISNSQSPFFWADGAADRLARTRQLVRYVGADVHLRGYLAGGFQYLPPFDDAAGFLAALRQADLQPRRFGPRYLAALAAQHLWEQVLRRSRPGFGANSPVRRATARAARGAERPPLAPPESGR